MMKAETPLSPGMRRPAVLGGLALLFSSAVALPVRGQAPPALPLKLEVRPLYQGVGTFVGGGVRHLPYELILTNIHHEKIRILAVQAVPRAGNLVLSGQRWSGDALAALFSSLQGPYTEPQAPVLDPAQAAVLYLDLDFPPNSPLPMSVQTSIELQVEGDESTRQTLVGPLLRASAADPVAVSPPLRGEGWYTPNGPSNDSIHRRILLALHGAIGITEKYAVDWVKLGANGATYQGDPARNTSYFAYGQDILAAADGKIVAVLDGVPENVPNQPPILPLTVETLGGNHIVQEIGGGRYAFYAHLVPGSLRVRPGELVQRGQVLAQLGNSGNSSQPHLHFHVMSGPEPLGPRPVPFVLRQWLQTSVRFTCSSGRAECSPLDGPTQPVFGPTRLVTGEAFMTGDVGGFRSHTW